MTNKKQKTEKLAIGAVLTAIVIVLQILAVLFNSFKLLPFSLTFVLVPIVLGAALCGTATATWLGFVFGVTVLLSGDAALFLGFSVPGTIVTVLTKGMLCGLVTGFVYSFIHKKSNGLAIWISSIVCPIVNTGIFILGCYVFFLKDLTAAAAGFGFENATSLIFIGFCGINFLVEFAINILLNPAITTVLKVVKTNK